MFAFFREIFEDLARSKDDPRHLKARKKAFTALALGIGLICAVGMPLMGYTLVGTLLGTLISMGSTVALTFTLFTPTRQRIVKWIDDIIHPPVPVIIAPPDADNSKAIQYKEIVANLVLAKTEKVDIKIIKDNLKKLFNLRSYMPLSNESFESRWKLFEEKYLAFQKKIMTDKEWIKIENITELKELTIDATILSDMMFAVLENDIRAQGQQVTTKTVANALTDQSKTYYRKFLDGALVGLYNFARGNTHYSTEGLLIRPIQSPESSPDYYQPGLKNDVRKIYNAFIKQGFYQRYGNKAFAQELATKDPRFEILVRKDSKKTRKFKAFADK